MNWVADESVDYQIVERFRELGHVVLYVAEFAPSIPDDEVLSIANKGAAPLITEDKDFGELVFRKGLSSHGVVLIRLAGLSQTNKAIRTVAAVTEHQSDIPGNFTVISSANVRIRKGVK